MLKLRGLAMVQEGGHGVASYEESALQEEVKHSVNSMSSSLCVLVRG